MLGTKFKGRIDSEAKVGYFPAIIPEITGSAYITEKNTLFWNLTNIKKLNLL